MRKGRTGRAFAATRYSVLALRPARPAESFCNGGYHWDAWARKVGLLDKHGEPSLSKVKMLIKHHVLAATISRDIATFHSYHPITNKPIFRKQARIIVKERCLEQKDWDAERWKAEYQALFSRSQANKAKGKRRRRGK